MKSNLYIDQNDSTVAIPIDNKNSSFLQNILTNIIQFSKRQFVLTIAIIAMLITCIFVPVDASYLGYFNWRTLATLFCTLAVVSAFSHIHVFEILSNNIVLKLHNLRNATLGLVFITFFGSMLLANDMALLTFLPLGYYVLSSTDNKEHMGFTFIMQNIAANLGGMVTPVIMDKTQKCANKKGYKYITIGNLFYSKYFISFM
ncbi:MAG: SLC13 family permease [bacterium]|nr:SLC13 family permease [bacterium]